MSYDYSNRDVHRAGSGSEKTAAFGIEAEETAMTGFCGRIAQPYP